MSIPTVPGLSQAVGPSPNFTYFPYARTFSLASFTLPGKWTLLDATKKFGWQIQKGYGLSGAFLFPTGDELVVAKFRGEFWASADWQIFREYRKTLFTKSVFTVGGTISSKAMGIDHPTLKSMGVTSVVVGQIAGEKQEDGGLWVQEIEFIQFRAPVIAPAKPTTSIPDVAKPLPTAQDAQDVEIQNAQKRLQGLLGQ